MLGYVWEDLTNYKKCRKKQYDIHVCKPPVNTVVINVLEQADVVAVLRGKTYFTVEEITTMKANNDNRFNFLQQALQAGRAYLVSANTPFVLAGSQGELWCISANTLAKKYNFVTGQGTEPINQQTLQRRMKNDCLDWTVVRTVPDNSQAWACFVNQSLRGQIATSWGAVLNINGAGVPHGKGDFVIAADVGGKPNLADRYVVNGNVFANTYNNQGWTDCLSTQAINNGTVNISDLPKLFNSATIKNAQKANDTYVVNNSNTSCS